MQTSSVDLSRLIVFVPLCFILIPKFGIDGTGYATAISFMVCFVVAMMQVNKKVKISLTRLKIRNALIAGIISAMLFYGLSLLSRSILTAFLCIVVGLIAYLALIVAFKVVKMKEIKTGVSSVLSKKGC